MLKVKSSKRQTTNFNRSQRVQQKLQHMWDRIWREKLSHEEWLALRQPIFDSDDWKKLTSYYKAYLQGLDHGHSAMIWYHVTWMFCVGKDEKGGDIPKLYMNCTPEEKVKLHTEEGQKNGHHYWTGTNRRWS